MKKFKKIGLLLGAAVLMAALIVAGCGGKKDSSQPNDGNKVLRIGAIPAEDAQKTREAYAAMVKYLENKTGMKGELFVATDYSGAIEAMRSGKLDIAVFGPFSYVLAAEKANAEAFAVEIRKGTGTTYKSLIGTHPESGINSLADLKGRTFSFVDPASTSGNLMPRYYFKKNNIDPDKEFKGVTYAGGHDACLLAIKNRKVDAGAFDDVSFNNMKNKGLVSDKDIKVVFQSDPIPGSPWAWRKDLPSDLKAKVKDAFLNMAKEDPNALGAIGGKVEGYAETTDDKYNIIRETAKVLNLDLAKR